jgi:general secretion pathway protein H
MISRRKPLSDSLGSRAKAARCLRRGVTLIEILVVVALITLASTAVLMGSGFIGNKRLRSAATLILGAVRLGMTRANTVGRPVRLVFDLDSERLILEETSGKLLRSEEEEEPPPEGTEGESLAERAAVDYAKGVLDVPRAPRPRFLPVADLKTEGDAEPGRSLGADVDLYVVQTEHDHEPRSDGRAYLYFWPAGGTERAVIQLTRRGDPDGLTILVSALTGRARIERGAVELNSSASDEKFGVREEEF